MIYFYFINNFRILQAMCYLYCMPNGVIFSPLIAFQSLHPQTCHWKLQTRYFQSHGTKGHRFRIAPSSISLLIEIPFSLRHVLFYVFPITSESFWTSLKTPRYIHKLKKCTVSIKKNILYIFLYSETSLKKLYFVICKVFAYLFAPFFSGKYCALLYDFCQCLRT